jgi:radical SAM protein with 4Fe4S-binding SPASM domain
MNLMEQMEEQEMPFRVSSLVTRQWLEDVESVKQFIRLLNRFSVVSWILYTASPTGEAYKDTFDDQHQLTGKEIAVFSNTILDLLNEIRPNQIGVVHIMKAFKWMPSSQDGLGLPVNDYWLQEGNDSLILCEEHKHILFMEPDGTVPFCTLFKSRFPQLIGSVREESLLQVWDKLCEIRIQHSIPKRKYCGSCDLLKYCGGGCPGEDPGFDADILSGCDTASKSILPHLMSDYDKIFNAQLLAN